MDPIHFPSQLPWGAAGEYDTYLQISTYHLIPGNVFLQIDPPPPPPTQGWKLWKMIFFVDLDIS